MNDSLRQIRINHKMTQEELSEKLGVSRQTIAKWESGESVPDIMKCSELADVYGLELEDIASMFIKRPHTEFRPSGKYIFGKCIIKHNLIALSDEAMTIFDLKDGDELLLLGDVKQGIGLMPIKMIEDFYMEFNNAPVLEVEDDEKSDKA